MKVAHCVNAENPTFTRDFSSDFEKQTNKGLNGHQVRFGYDKIARKVGYHYQLTEVV